MYNNTALTSWTGNLSSLTYGYWMFRSCENLTSFNATLPSLTDGERMFQRCYKLSAFSYDLPSLADGNRMFEYCALTSFNSDLSSLSNGEYMFNGCTNLTTFTSDLPNLTYGYYMFYNCKKISSFNVDLDNLTNGEMMFMGCSSLTSFNSSLPSLINGTGMFDLCKLDTTSINSIALGINKTGINGNALHLGIETATLTDSQVKRDLGLLLHKGWSVYIGGTSAFSSTSPKYAGCTTIANIKAKDANYLANGIVNGIWGEHLPDFNDYGSLFNSAGSVYDNAKALTKWIGDLSSLKNGSSLFYNSPNLTSFTSNLSNLTNGHYMFNTCVKLSSFNSPLPSLTKGTYMFNYCETLTTFNSKLKSLTNGYYMFRKCILNTASVQKIANSIKNVTSLTNGTSNSDAIYKQIDIGIGNSTPNSQEKTAFNTIASKGWTVYVNGSTYSPTSGSSIVTLDEDGNEVETPIPFYAKPVPATEETASYVDSEGNYYNIQGGQFIYGDDLSTYGMFTCENDAAANMRLTKIEK